MDPFPWTCPYCARDTTVTEERVHEAGTHLTINNADGDKHFGYFFVVCPNKGCRRFTLTAMLHSSGFDRQWGTHRKKELEQVWHLIPPSKAKVFPDYVPKPIIDDYSEACLIAEPSPKASATLARRCLQGLIRDFWKVKPGRLVDEIKAIEDKVDPITWAAIDSVRTVGNIGAHMEKDINLIVEVDPHEAELLIGLIETLIQDWYVAREERQTRLAAITAMAGMKKPKKAEQAGAGQPATRSESESEGDDNPEPESEGRSG